MRIFEKTRMTAGRLDLVAATPEHVRAELDGPERLEALLRAEVGGGWPPGEYERDVQEFFLARLVEGGADACGWYGWYALLRGDGAIPAALVGAGGYFGPPDAQGTVEIGYSLLPAWRGRGLAVELARGLVLNALAEPRVRRVVARSPEANAASCRVLEKCLLLREGLDEESGCIRFVMERGGEAHLELRAQARARTPA